MRVFRSVAYAEPMELVRRHSTACAHLSRLVASFTPIATEYAFLCGLLHDVGIAAALILLGEDKKTASGIDSVMLAMALQQCHQEASAVLTRLWKLPQDIQLVVRHHHDVIIERHPHPLAAVVALAEDLTRENGMGITINGQRCDETSDNALMHARNAVGFDKHRMEKVRNEAKKLIATLERGAVSAAVRASEERPPRKGGA